MHFGPRISESMNKIKIINLKNKIQHTKYADMQPKKQHLQKKITLKCKLTTISHYNVKNIKEIIQIMLKN